MAVHQKRHAGRLNTIWYQVEVSPQQCTNIKACWPCGHCGLQVSLQSVPSLGLLSVASMSPSSLLLLSSDEESVLASSSKASIGTQAHTFKAKARLEVTAGDPNDIGLSEQELRPESLAPRLISGGAELLTGDPGARPSNTFSPAMTGDIGASNPRRAKSNGGIVGEVSLKCGSVLGPAAPVVVSGKALDWEPNGWLDWDPNPSSGSNKDFASNSSSNVQTRSVSCLGILYGLGWLPPRGLVMGAHTKLG